MNTRITSQIQHAMQYPSGHLDRFASFGPSFEMGAGDVGSVSSMPTAAAAAAEATEPTAGTTAQLTAVDGIRAFITAGKAIFTLQGQTARYTFKVSKREASDQYTQDAWFISLLTGPDNLADYTYMGMLDAGTGAVRLTKASKYREDSQPFKAISWAFGRIWAGRSIEPATFYHVGRCGRCGRALTVPSSIESGFGPECLGKL